MSGIVRVTVPGVPHHTHPDESLPDERTNERTEGGGVKDGSQQEEIAGKRFF
ncbi:MAG: hypothetical protein GY777_08815 [Candidatus Brocadiaceae bacterium]|nr:hypothetical protein [Candidatus Brocadiaceae bacterium]